MKPRFFAVLGTALALSLCWSVLCWSGQSAGAPPDAEQENLLEEWARLKQPLERQPVKDNQEATLIDKVIQVQEVFEGIGRATLLLFGGEKIDPAPLEEQVTPQFTQLLNAELRFVRSVCEPTPEQYKTLELAGETGLKVVVKRYVRVQIKMQQGQQSNELYIPDPHKIISDNLANSVEQTLSADQTKRYKWELDKRAAARRRAAQLNLVAEVDKAVVLTAEQRTELLKTLSSNWKDAWGQQLEMYAYGVQSLGILPDQQVIPILNGTQQEIWKAIPKNQEGFFGGGIGIGFPQFEDLPVDLDVHVDLPAAAEQEAGEKIKDTNPK